MHVHVRGSCRNDNRSRQLQELVCVPSQADEPVLLNSFLKVMMLPMLMSANPAREEAESEMLLRKRSQTNFSRLVFLRNCPSQRSTVDSRNRI